MDLTDRRGILPKLADYTIDHEGVQWATLLRAWAWLLPRDFTVWIMNRFGDLFIALEDGSIRMLDVGAGSFHEIAKCRDHFCALIDEPGHADDWLMIPLVDQLTAAGLTLNPGQCYSFRELPLLGGGYTIDNTVVVTIEHHYLAFGPIHEKLKDLPNGATVRFEVAE